MCACRALLDDLHIYICIFRTCICNYTSIHTHTHYLSVSLHIITFTYIYTFTYMSIHHFKICMFMNSRMYTGNNVSIHTHTLFIYVSLYTYKYTYIHMYPPDPINNVCSLTGKQISQNDFTYRSVQYLKSCSGDFILQNLILRTRLCGTGFITQ